MDNRQIEINAKKILLTGYQCFMRQRGVLFSMNFHKKFFVGGSALIFV